MAKKATATANIEQVEDLTNQGPAVEETDTVELEWSEVEDLFYLRQELISMERYYTNITLQLEKNKTSIIGRIMQLESAFYERANILKGEKVGETEELYELKLPNSPNEPAFLLKGEDN